MLPRTRLIRQRARRRLMGPAVRRWQQRRLWRRSRRLVVASGVLLLVAGSTAVYKLRPADLQQIEAGTGKTAESLTDAELNSAIHHLGIQELELTDAERRLVNLVVDDV